MKTKKIAKPNMATINPVRVKDRNHFQQLAKDYGKPICVDENTVYYIFTNNVTFYWDYSQSRKRRINT